MQNTISEDKNSIRKLEASVTKAYGNVPGSFRTQNREIAQLSERVQTAEATAHAANAVVDKYEREVFMLRAALDIHAHEFRDGSGETVHASLVLALGQVQTHHFSVNHCPYEPSIPSHIMKHMCNRHVKRTGNWVPSW